MSRHPRWCERCAKKMDGRTGVCTVPMKGDWVIAHQGRLYAFVCCKCYRDLAGRYGEQGLVSWEDLWFLEKLRAGSGG